MEHTVPGVAAGFLFQPERALLHLALGGEMVGIETTDDVVSRLQDGRELREQAKHTIVGRNPFTDKGRDLWRTLEIWLKALQEEIEAHKLKLYLVTNASVPDGLARSIADASKAEEINKVATEIIETAESIDGEARESARAILAATPEDLADLIACIELIDADQAAGSVPRSQLTEGLNIPDEVDSEAIVQSLLGWVHDTSMELWRAGQTAWISRKAFKLRASRVISRYVSNRIVERTVAAIPVSNSERRKHANRLFLQQIRLLDFPEEAAADYLMEAVDDFIRCLAERTRLLEHGQITGGDLQDFEERLFQRWKTQSRRHWLQRDETDPRSSCECGQRLYQESIEHRESLAGVPTEQYYLTRGSLHSLTDKPRLGWHPDYRTLLKAHALKNNSD